MSILYSLWYLGTIAWNMRVRCRLLVVLIICLLLIFQRWLFSLFDALCHLNSAVLFAQLVDLFGLPSTLYMQNVLCPGCNRFAVRYLITPRQTVHCTADKPIYLLVLVISRPDDYFHRLTIRRTWGSVSAHRDKSIRTFFVCGQAPNSTVQDMLESEAKRWHDILQVWYLIAHVQCDEYASLPLI